MTDKRYRIGIWVTGLYLLTLAIYAYVQRDAVLAMKPNEFGDALAGAASPLAFLWLVLGYLQQGEELRQNTEALNLQVKELQASVDQQRALVEATQRQHEFELERDKAQRRTALLSSQPLFHSSLGQKEANDTHVVWVLTLKNLGRPCTKVDVHLRDDTAIEIEGELVLAFEHNYQRRWEIRVSHTGDSQPIVLAISYTDANGEQQVQELRLQIVVPGDGSVFVYPLDGPTQIYPWEQEQIAGLVAAQRQTAP